MYILSFIHHAYLPLSTVSIQPAPYAPMERLPFSSTTGISKSSFIVHFFPSYASPPRMPYLYLPPLNTWH